MRLVVGDAAREELAVTLDELPRVRLPELERVRRLDVEVRVDEQRRRSWSSTVPPAPRLRSATQSAAPRTSSACAGSALIDGIAISSASSATSWSCGGITRAIVGMLPRRRRGPSR